MEHGGQERSGNLRSSSTARARKFWSAKSDPLKDTEMKNTDAQDEDDTVSSDSSPRPPSMVDDEASMAGDHLDEATGADSREPGELRSIRLAEPPM